ncbi:MAG: DUF4340 domain-containing protein [candidate division WOR-3 bacterium]
MKYKNLIILICVIVILLLILTLTGKKPQAKPIITVDELNTVLVCRPSDTTEIEIKNNNYQITRPFTYPGDSSAIAFLMNNLKNLKLGEVISRRKEKFEDFEVGEKGVKLILRGKKEIAFYIGKYAGDYQHSYFRFDNDDKVYLVSGINKHQVNIKPDDWRDKTILKVNQELIEKISIDDKEIVKKDTLWMYKDKIIDRYKIDVVLRTLSELRATGFSDTSSFRITHKIKIFTSSGIEFALEIGDKRDYNYLAKLPDKPTIFLLNEYTLNNFLNLIPAEEKKKK